MAVAADVYRCKITFRGHAMPTNSQRFLEGFAAAFMQGCLAQLTDNFAYPIPIFERDEVIVFGSAETLREGLQIYLDAVRQHRIAALRPRVIAEGLPIKGYFNLWVEWDHLAEDGACVRTSQVRYVAYRAPNALFPRIEMVDYAVTAFPELRDTLPVVAGI